MTRPLLPPRAAHIAARMNNPLSPPASLNMRGLAWDGMVTPPLRSQELAALTGKRQATIYRHMSLPRTIPAFSWRSTGLGTVIVPVAVQSSGIKGGPVILKKIPDSKNLESPHPLNPHSFSSLIPVFDSGFKESNQIRRNDVNGGDEEGKFSRFLESYSRFLESRFGFLVPSTAPGAGRSPNTRTCFPFLTCPVCSSTGPLTTNH